MAQTLLKMKIPFFYITIFLLILLSGVTVFAQNESFSVNVTHLNKEARSGDSFEISAEIDILPDHFIYKDKTRLELEPVDGFVLEPAVFPKAHIKFDKFQGKDVEIFEKAVSVSAMVSIAENIEPEEYKLKLFVYYQGCSDKICFIPQRKEFIITVNVLTANNNQPTSASSAGSNTGSTSFEKTIAKRGLLGALVFAFIAGIGVSFTPCIYPMIPITVAIVGGQSINKPLKGFYLSLFYVLGIAVVYSALGVAAASTGSLFGSAVKSPWVVGFVAVVFVGLALSMFGVYELKLPAAMAEKFGGKKKGGGIIGVFFMGLVSGTVASPCVGPVLVSLLVYIASTGSMVLGFWLLFVFSWGMGLLLIAVGTFSGVLNVLPKSGLWMVMVKKILGIVLLGAALYYLKAIIPEGIFVVVLGIFLITVGVFSGGLDRIVTESAVLLRVKKSFGLLCIIFGIYFLVGTLLIKGLILEPFTFTQTSTHEVSGNNKVETNGDAGIEWILSEEQGLKLARNTGKPAMIDFWAEWCSVCKKLEKKTFPDPIIFDESKKFVNIKVDCTDVDDPKIKSLWAKYGIVGLPTIIFVGRNGNILREKTVNGFIPPAELKKIMEKF